MRNLKVTAVLAVAASLLAAAPSAGAAFEIEAFDGRVSAGPAPSPLPNPGTPADAANFAPIYTQAGGHPYDASVTFRLKQSADGGAEGGQLRNVDVELPPGLVGNPAAVPQCLNSKRIMVVGDIPPGGSGFDPERMCSPQAVVGTAVVSAGYFEPPSTRYQESYPAPVYNVEPPPGAAAAFAFDVQGGITVITAHLEDNGDYNVSVRARDALTPLNIIGSEVTLWGNPADPRHDDLRCATLTSVGIEFLPPSCAFFGTNPPGTPLGPNAATYPERAFLTNPTACTAPGEGLETSIDIEAYNGARADASFESHDPGGYFITNPVPHSEWGAPHGPDGCEKVPFEPQASLEPTSAQADSPTGLEVDLSLPSKNLEDVDAIAQSHLKKAVVTLPEGMTVNPSSAAGLGACAPSQLAAETAASAPGAGCPESARIGTVRVESPLLAVRDANGEAQRDEDGDVIARPLEGSVYLASQRDNPFGSLLALYIVVKDPERGIVLKLPGRVDPDPGTGRLTATFDDNPQLPFSSLRVRFKDGPRAPLIAPRQCGTYEIETELYPWARPGEPVRQTSSFEVTSGPNGSPCPAGGQFDPGFEAGTVTPIAGAYSPLIVNASRPEGSAPLAGLTLDLPEGLLAKLTGVPYCPEAALAAAAGRNGAAELGSPSCPAASRIGSVDVGAGAGSLPFHVKGAAYLAGPYKGAPLSIATVTPAVAGPFDLGTVVVRARAEVDSRTARIHVVSDPIPQILQGIPLQVRSISVDTDRPGFTLNPTDCDPTLFGGTLLGASTSRAVASRFQVGACRALAFKPKLSLRLKGATKRSGNPALTAVLRQRPGGANIERASVAMPKSEFLAQAHIRTICTRVQFAARSCPPGSVYGSAAAFSPLLDHPLRGLVYLRSSNNQLPDLVADLRGQIDIELVGRIDSFRRGIRTTFDTVPDAPVTKFVLKMKGGKRSLLENSVNLCRSTNRATVRMRAQNGLARNFRPPVRAVGCGKKKQR